MVAYWERQPHNYPKPCPLHQNKILGGTHLRKLQRDLYLEQSVRVLRALQVQYWYCMAGWSLGYSLEPLVRPPVLILTVGDTPSTDDQVFVCQLGSVIEVCFGDRITIRYWFVFFLRIPV